MKTCTVCKQPKPNSEFSRAGNGYLRGDCKTCEMRRKKQLYAQRKGTTNPTPRLPQKQHVLVLDETDGTLYVCEVLSSLTNPKQLAAVTAVLEQGGAIQLKGSVYRVLPRQNSRTR